VTLSTSTREFTWYLADKKVWGIYFKSFKEPFLHHNNYSKYIEKKGSK